MKPSWKDAPAWANWLAMDEDGEWYWYQNKPFHSSCFSHWNSSGALAQIVALHKNWKKSLTQRPSKKRGEP